MGKQLLTTYGLTQVKHHAMRLDALGMAWNVRIVTLAQAKTDEVFDPPCAYLQLWNAGVTIRVCDDGEWYITDHQGNELVVGSMRKTSRYRYRDLAQDLRVALVTGRAPKHPSLPGEQP